MLIKALVFDAYGTLFDVHSVVARCEALWPGHGAILSERWRAKQLEYTWLRSLMGRYENFERVTRDSLRYACDSLKLDCVDTQVAILLEEYRRLEAFPEIEATLPRLKGRQLAILSNGSPEMLNAVVRHNRLDTVLDATLSVDELKIYKPAPPVYQLAVDRLGVDAPQIGFVSSNGWDAGGARSFGFRTFWINRAGAPVERLDVEPDAILASLADLPARLG
jgi:2-haloacid dehalogenase